MVKDDDDKGKRFSPIEQHISTVMQIIVISLLLWSSSTTLNLTNDVAVLRTKVDILTTQLSAGVKETYGIEEARADRADYQRRDAEIERRVQRLEDRIERESR